MEIKTGMVVKNNLSNGQSITVRVMEFVQAVQMFRVTDARETDSDAKLIERNRTWAVPIENLEIDETLQYINRLLKKETL